MSKYFYGLISNAQELKELHEAAVLHGKLEIGLSRGKLLYAWDEDRENIKTIKTEEAAKRLGLTIAQVDQIISTNAEVVFDEPVETLEVKSLATFQEEAIPLVDTPREEPEAAEEVPVIEPEAVEEVPVIEPVKELPTEPKIDAPGSVQETPQPKAENSKLTKTALIALADSIIQALEEFKAFIED